MDKLTIDKYRLTLTHEIIIDDVVVEVKEPRVLEAMCCDGRRNIKEYQDYFLGELFRRFMEELKE